jgi:hypothetical protein
VIVRAVEWTWTEQANLMTRLSRLRPFPGFDVIGLLRKTCENPFVRHALRNRADVCGRMVDEFDAAMVDGRIVNFVPCTEDAPVQLVQ